MKITEIGEFGFINRIAQRFNKLPENIIGIGDDCAVIDYDPENFMIVTTDMLVERVHFLKEKISAYDLGGKSIAVNISDIAAMGGKPHSAFISLGIPKSIDVEWLDEFYSGITKKIEKYGVYLLGGDTTSSPETIIINIAIIGFVGKKYIKLRSGAKKNDVICVTGFLGDSAAGLKILLENKTLDEDAIYLIKQHNCPEPHFEEALWLSQYDGVNSMMDVSDGIDSDLKRIMEMSNCGVEVYLEQLPTSPQFDRVCEKYGWNKYELAATGGEDYCLLLTIDQNSYDNISDAFYKKFFKKLVRIGKIVSDQNYFNYYLNNVKTVLKTTGYNHFIS